MSDSWYSAPLPDSVRETPRRFRRGAGLALVFASVLATGAATGAWGDGVRAVSGSPDTTAGRAPASATFGGGTRDRAAASAARRAGGSTGRAGAANEGEDARELVSRSGDRWSAAYTAREYEGFQRSLNGEYVGVGISVRREHDVHGAPAIDVDHVRAGSPAARAGVRAGDRLRAVDGRNVADSPVTDVVARLRGSKGPGSKVGLTLGRGGRQWHETLHRARLVSDAVTVHHTADTTRIKISAFTKGSGEQVRAAVAKAVAHGWGIELDLRGNSGGLVSEAGIAASAFLNGGLIATFDENGRQRAVYADESRAADYQKSQGGSDAPNARADRSEDREARADGMNPARERAGASRPLVVLVDGGTMSAAELLTGALQDRGRAVVVGSRTFGKGTVQMPRKLPDGSVAELTVGHYATPSGRRIDGQGITPDLSVGAPEHAASRARTVLSGLETRS